MPGVIDICPPAAIDIVELPDDWTAPTTAPTDAPTTAPTDAPTTAPGKMKLYVATPCYGCYMTTVFLACIVGLQNACSQRGIECVVDFIGNESLVERARNIMVARFLQSDATHLLFIDADIGFAPEAVFRLLGADKDVVTGVYAKKAVNWGAVREKLAQGSAESVHQIGLDFNINIASEREQVANGYVRVLDSATGFMLIRRSVLERMAQHYRDELHCVNDIPNQDIKQYVAIFACMIDPDTRRFLSEDYSFCRRYQALGGEIWADLLSPLSHIGNSMFEGDLRDRLPAPQR